jgi:hypothetical protein
MLNSAGDYRKQTLAVYMLRSNIQGMYLMIGTLSSEICFSNNISK